MRWWRRWASVLHRRSPSPPPPAVCRCALDVVAQLGGARRGGVGGVQQAEGVCAAVPTAEDGTGSGFKGVEVAVGKVIGVSKSFACHGRRWFTSCCSSPPCVASQCGANVVRCSEQGSGLVAFMVVQLLSSFRRWAMVASEVEVYVRGALGDGSGG
jgi:hypothetical protein